MRIVQLALPRSPPMAILDHTILPLVSRPRRHRCSVTGQSSGTPEMWHFNVVVRDIDVNSRGKSKGSSIPRHQLSPVSPVAYIGHARLNPPYLGRRVFNQCYLHRRTRWSSGRRAKPATNVKELFAIGTTVWDEDI